MPTRKSSNTKAVRERELRRQGREALADPQRVARHARQAMSPDSTVSITRFSLRNQMMLAAQAEAKGITLTDIDTYKGWWRRGRKPLRTKDALFVTVPSTYRPKPSGGHADPDTGADTDADTDNDSDGSESGLRGFYIGRRWDISQTVELDADDLTEHPGQGDCVGCPARAGQPCQSGCTCFACSDDTEGQTPADAMWNTLQHDITRAGYRFVWPGDTHALSGRHVHIEHDTKTVHVSLLAPGDQDGLTALAVAAAHILTWQPSPKRQPAIAIPA